MDKPEIGIYIDRTYKVVRQDLINRFKNANIDLTPEQWILLAKLSESGSLSQTELAFMSFKDKPTVSRIIDLLVKKGYVKRTADELDRRKFIIEIKEKGFEIIKEATPIVESSRKVGWNGLSKEEYQLMRQTLDKIFANYTEETLAP